MYVCLLKREICTLVKHFPPYMSIKCLPFASVAQGGWLFLVVVVDASQEFHSVVLAFSPSCSTNFPLFSFGSNLWPFLFFCKRWEEDVVEDIKGYLILKILCFTDKR